MQRLLGGLCVLLLSVVIAATFVGTRSLVVLWVLTGLAGLGFILLSQPVRERVQFLDRLLSHGPDLKVAIKHEDWDNFQHQARILEIRVEVKNRTHKRKKLTSFAVLVHGSPTTDPSGTGDIELHREVERRRKNHRLLTAIAILEPKETVKGWMIFPFPWSSDPGPPGYSFVVRDELNVDFVARGESALPLPQVTDSEATDLTSEIVPDPRQVLLNFLGQKKEAALPIANWIEGGLPGGDYREARGAGDDWAGSIFQKLLAYDKELALLFNDDGGERYTSMQPGEFLSRRLAQLDKVITELEQRE